MHLQVGIPVENFLISVEAIANTEPAHMGGVTTMKVNMMELSGFIKWSVAGDGYVGYATNNKNAHYSIERLAGHKDYIEVVASKIAGLQDCTVNVREYKRKDGKDIVTLRTTSHPLFSRVRSRQYIDNHRVIDPHMLTVLNWERMAFLYMDDGSLCYNGKGFMIVRLSTCAYSFPEQQALVGAAREKLGVQFSINRAAGGRYQLNLLRSSHSKFFENIEQYIVQSYGYKLP